MPDWVWFGLGVVVLVACYAIMGSFVGGLFGPDRPDKADAHALSDRGLLIRRVAMIGLGLLALYAIVDYVAEW